MAAWNNDLLKLVYERLVANGLAIDEAFRAVCDMDMQSPKVKPAFTNNMRELARRVQALLETESGFEVRSAATYVTLVCDNKRGAKRAIYTIWLGESAHLNTIWNIGEVPGSRDGR